MKQLETDNSGEVWLWVEEAQDTQWSWGGRWRGGITVYFVSYS